jgi:hypothetical protein
MYKEKESDLLQMKVTEIYAVGKNFTIITDLCFGGCYIKW